MHHVPPDPPHPTRRRRLAAAGATAAVLVAALYLAVPRSGGDPESAGVPRRDAAEVGTGEVGTAAAGMPDNSPPPSPAGSPAPPPRGSPTSAAPPAPRRPAPRTGFPDASTTGVPPGTTLTPMRGQQGTVTISTHGAVVDGRDIDGCVAVQANDVTIRRSRIRCPDIYGIRLHEEFGGLLVEDSELDGMNANTDSQATAGGNMTLRRLDIHGWQDGPRLGSNTVVERSVVHDLYRCGDGCHNDAIQTTGASNVVIRGNALHNPHHQTSCLMLGDEFGPIDNVLVEGNLLDGGNYTIYIGHGTSAPNLVVRGNHFTRDGHVYGLLSADDRARVEWTGNVWHGSNTPAVP